MSLHIKRAARVYPCHQQIARIPGQDRDNMTQSYGWWYTYPSENYEFVNWDYEIFNIWKNNIHIPKHQPDYYKPTIIKLL